MARRHFRVILTESANDPQAAARIHQQKLNNFRMYDFADTDENTNNYKRATPIDFNREICSQSTTSVIRDHTFCIITSLDVEDESWEEQRQEDKVGHEIYTKTNG